MSSRLDLLENGGHNLEDEQDDKSNKLDLLKQNLKEEVRLIVSQHISESFKQIEKRVFDVESKFSEDKAELQHLFNERFSQETDQINADHQKIKSEISSLLEQTKNQASPQSISQEGALLAQISSLASSLAKFDESTKSEKSAISELSRKHSTIREQLEGMESLMTSLKTPTPAHQQITEDPQQQIAKLKYLNESLSSKIDTLRYELDLIKGDVVKQRRSQGEYLSRVDDIEKRISNSSSVDHNQSRATNFMSNTSAMTMKNDSNRFFGQPLQQLIGITPDSEQEEENSLEISGIEAGGNDESQIDADNELMNFMSPQIESLTRASPLKPPQTVTVTPQLPSTQVNTSRTNTSLTNRSIKLKTSQIRGISVPDESSVSLLIDDDFYLLNKDGYKMLDDYGQPIRLSEEEIEALKEQGQYTEEFVD